MALITCQFVSQALQQSCTMSVILPQLNPPPKKFPTLWLLHGMSSDHTAWVRRTEIEDYAAKAKLAVIMPSAPLSWYQDMAAGPAYFTFLSEELPAIARSFFPLSPQRRDNFIAGLSMGGYGAFFLALSRPENYAAAISLSGALDVASNVYGDDKNWRAIVKAAFGDPQKVRGSQADLLFLARKLTRSSRPKPKLYACCGSKDFLLHNNHQFVAQAKKIGLPLTYEEHPGETHDWPYWNKQIRHAIQWLPRR